MANDNQTALMMSIQRKKDKLDELWHGPVQPWTERIRGQIDLIRELITEDEKLLAVEKDRNDLVDDVLNGLDEACNGMEWRVDSEPETLDKSDYEKLGEWRETLKRYNEKYGTDGK